jgi:NAD-reducing hydrogenase small subunit
MKARVATAWLAGCSGCHMSLLDMDERIIELADKIDLVYSPLIDIKEFPENVDVTLVEGSVNDSQNEKQIRIIRDRTRILVALGDCAVTGNVPSMRNSLKPNQVLERAYLEKTNRDPQIPSKGVPQLLLHADPIHSIVKVDLFVPGCPPSADLIHLVITELLEGRVPDLASLARFGK